MIHDETPQGKSREKSPTPQPQTEEDLDFEILDALENIDDAGSRGDSQGVERETDNQDAAFELDLDDDVLMDDSVPGETEEFSLDTNMASGFGLGNLDGADEADSLDADAVIPGLDEEDTLHIDEDDDGSFSLDLDEDEGFDLSFDDEIDLDLDGDHDADGLDLAVFSAPGLDMEEDAPELDDAPPALDAFGSEADEAPEPDDMELETPDLNITSAGGISALAREDAAFLDEDEEPDSEFAMAPDQESEEFSGTSVISIDGDEVFNLGDESDISSIADADSASWEDDELHVDDDFFDDEDDDDGFFDDDDDDLAELAKGAQDIADHIETAEPEASPDDAENAFMSSLDDIHIDLHDDDDEEEMETFSADGDDGDFGLPEVLTAPEEPAPSDEDFEVPNLAEAFVDDQDDDDGELAEAPAALEAEPAGEDGADIPDRPREDAETEPEPEEPDIDVREALGLVPRLPDDDVEQFDHMILEAKTLQTYLEELEEHQPEIKSAIYAKLHKEYNDRKADLFREPDFISFRIDIEQDLEDMARKSDEVQQTINGLNDELEEVQVRHLVGEYTDEELAREAEARQADIEDWQQKNERLEHYIVQYRDLLESEKLLNPLDEEDEAEPETEAEPEAALDEAMPEVGVKSALDVAEHELPADLESLVSEEAPEEMLTEDALAPEVPEKKPVRAEKQPEDAGEEPETSLEAALITDAVETGIPEEPGMADVVDGGILEEPADVEGEDADDDDLGALGDLGDIGDLSNILDDEGGDWDGDDGFELSAEGFDEDEFTLDTDFADDGDEVAGFAEDEFEIDGIADGGDEADDGDLLNFGDTDDDDNAAEEQEAAMIACKKCGRSTPASEKFCVNCGAKAQ